MLLPKRFRHGVDVQAGCIQAKKLYIFEETDVLILRAQKISVSDVIDYHKFMLQDY